MKNKSKIKKYLFKTLHIIGYISTFLVILFSILLGVNSCNNTDNTDKKINNKENQSVLSVLREEKQPNFLTKENNTYSLSYSELFYPDFWEGFYNILTSTNVSCTCTYSIYGRGGSGNLASSNTYTYIKRGDMGFGSSYHYVIFSNGGSNDGIGFQKTNLGVYYNIVPNTGAYLIGVNNFTLTTTNTTIQNYLDTFLDSVGGYTQNDLEEAYQEGYWSGEDVGYENGYSEGYDVGYYNGFTNANNENFSDFNLLINSQTNFNYLATDQYLTQYLPNVYRLNNLQLNEFQSSYTFHDIEFTYEGSDHVYNSISVVFKQLSDFNFNVSNGELTFLAFTDSNITLNNTLSDYVNYEGCTYFTNLLGLDNLSRFYYLDSISYYYDDLEQEGEIITDNLQVFEGKKYINNLPLYVSDNSASPSLVASNETRTGLAFVKNGWLNENYRKLYVISNNNQLLNVQNTALNNYTLVEFLSGAYINPNNGATTTEVNNMFDMFSLAFTGLIPILNVQLLPYITIGSLLFIPLIITIILIVIKLLKRG